MDIQQKNIFRLSLRNFPRDTAPNRSREPGSQYEPDSTGEDVPVLTHQCDHAARTGESFVLAANAIS